MKTSTHFGQESTEVQQNVPLILGGSENKLHRVRIQG